MDASKPTGQRLIGHGFHIHFSVRLLTAIAAGVLAISAMLYQFMSQDTGRTFHEAKFNIYRMKTDAYIQVFESYYTVAVFGLIALVVAAISLRYSHRIAGPIYRLEKSIALFGEGDLNIKVKFRSRDALGPLADETNAAIRLINHKVRTCQDAIAIIGSGEQRLRELLSDDKARPDAVRQAVEEIKFGAESLKRTSDTIKTGEADA
ncbi:MAG: hypothetical protein A3J24_10720 [Deltaproteobacteria bacterium RIFCSPLOWO2_02_FULL_53_8]|nr:MAG: hypothetical protein A3J24_10720 [Deltaproteobacteria bacterium RIFCSPLOWO2_02_FULL_53_8]